MKPYKIIKSSGPMPRKKIIIDKMAPRKIPLWFIKNTHTPPKAEIVAADQGT